MKKYILLSALVIVATLSYSQNYVNKYLLEPFGNPTSDNNWSVSTTDGYGNIITVGNTIVDANNVALYTVKQNGEGQILWENAWVNPTLTDSKSYGIALTVDANDNVIVVGATTPDTELNADIVALKYTPSGTQSWSKIIQGSGGLADIPAAVISDANGHIYLTGITQSLSTRTDFYTCKLNGSTSNFIWQETTDNGAGLDIATHIRLNAAGHPVITGVSSIDGLNWDVKVVQYSANNGTIQNQNTLESVATNDEFLAVDLKTDSDGNFYLLSQKAGNSMDIRLTKLNEDLEQQWENTFDLAGNTDRPSGLNISEEGIIVVMASSQNIQGKYELITLAYKPDGVLMWQKSRRPASSQEEVKGVCSIVSTTGDVYSVGELKKNGGSNLVIVKYNSVGEPLWEQRHGNGHDFVVGCVHESQLFVTAKHEYEEESKYYTLRFEEYVKENPIIYDNDTELPINRANELIVKFDSEELIIDNIDNLDLKFGPPEVWLTEGAITKIESRVELRGATFIRIFKTLKSTYHTSVSRLGETVPIPDFYAAFVVDFPDGTDLEATISNLQPLFPTVKYAHRNYLATLSDVPNDPLYPDQKSLENPTSSVENDINIEPFWEEETGKSYIKVGVLDFGLDLEHEDFAVDNQTSVAVGGWDYATDAPLSSLSSEDQDSGGHGTRTSGIIGAVRNNETGIAGIAGGFPDGSSDPADRGVSLYGLKLFPSLAFDLASQADAIVTASTDDSSMENAFGVHVLQAGYNLFNAFSNTDVQLLSDGIRYANRNKVSFINSSGNAGSDNLSEVSCSYPACLDGDWITVVSGTGTNGQYKQFFNGSPDDFFPNRGDYVDIAAPCVTQLVWTTQGIDEPGSYTEWSGTSASSAHASGVAALLLSYNNTPTPSYGNLAPEDTEFIFKATAIPTDLQVPNPEILTGSGRLNAAASFNLIQKPFRRLVHFGTDNDSNTKSSSLVASDITINLTEPYDNAAGISFAPDSYTADVYKISATVDQTISSTDIILHSWERHSSSTLFPLAVNGGDLVPHEKVDLIEVTDNQGFLEGYVYELKDANGVSLGWIPFDVADLGSAELCYSLILEDQLFTNVNNIDNSLSVSISPNPTSNRLEINISNVTSGTVDIQLVDVFGRRMLDIHTGQVHDSLNKSINLSELVNGLYYVVITSDNSKIVKPITKQ